MACVYVHVHMLHVRSDEAIKLDLDKFGAQLRQKKKKHSRAHTCTRQQPLCCIVEGEYGSE